jgi:hypothetical protein
MMLIGLAHVFVSDTRRFIAEAMNLREPQEPAHHAGDLLPIIGFSFELLTA